MSLKKTATQEAPHAHFTLERAGWEWKVLKCNKTPASEAKDQYAIWFVAATSPHMQGMGFECGDTYKRDILSVHPRLESCTQEFADAYPDLLNLHTTITDAPNPADSPLTEARVKLAAEGKVEHPDVRMFNAWMKRVNRFISAECGLDSDDLPDQNYKDFYDEGRDPHEVALAVLAEEGFQA